jgi:hypothetical protein
LVPVAVGISDFGLDGPEEVACLSLARAREAAEAVFVARGTHEWPPELVVPESWREPLVRAASEMDAELSADIDRAAARVRALIAKVATA